MRFVRFLLNGEEGLALDDKGELVGFAASDPRYTGSLDTAIAEGTDGLKRLADALSKGDRIEGEIQYLPPFAASGKIICVGLNYRAHSAESGYEQPDYPTVFARFTSSLIGHQSAIVRPDMSDTLDFEGELVAVIGKAGFKIDKQDALDYVAGYSIFNDGSVREYQHLTPQWTVGKNFDATGGFGPAFVTADELPKGCLGLTLETRLNGNVVQHARIDDMVFGVADLVSILSASMTIEPGDLIVTGTPSGVGASRKPPLYMRPGDVCEVEIEGIGTLVNPIASETVA
ncbi:fumarylacetoacetate hydrolase family protein [Roseibium sp.]|uniref:fumarylacetoacetate hydrolase family protein n=1 Tax=Roseibium sp. TaxID=1936156 RepID=UPI003A96E4D9